MHSTAHASSAHGSSAPARPQSEPERLPSPVELRARHRLSASAELFIRETRGRIRARLKAERHESPPARRGPPVAIVGPCSLHSEDAALAYAERLAPVAKRLEEDLIVVMRAYFEKPRTTVGWKGFLYDPDLDGSEDLVAGVSRTRSLLCTLAEEKLALATEILDPIAAPFFEDCLSWAAIGARTAESQPHRQLASGLPCPVGFKNGTDGSVDVAIAALRAAAAAHSHLGVGPDGRVQRLRTRGNDAAHVVLRGGKSGPNYDERSVGSIGEALRRAGEIPRLLVDCSHGNSRKDPLRQPAVARAVVEQRNRRDVDLFGIMLESHVLQGRQEPSPQAAPQQSVTDPCLGFEETERVLEGLARATAIGSA